MFNSRAIENLRDPQNILFRAVFMERKLLKHHLKDVSIASIIVKLRLGHISVRMGGFAILGLTKILTRKLRYLLEDCNEVISLICHRAVAKDKRFKSLPAKGITLKIDLDDQYIDDEMIDTEEFNILPEIAYREDGGLEADLSLENPDFDSFNDMSYVEQVRLDSVDSTRISAMTDPTQINLSGGREKKRRTVIDMEAEFDPQRFRENLRDTRDIIHKGLEMDIRRELVSKLAIAPEILSRLRCLTPHPRESIETMRNMSLGEEYADLDFQSNVVESAGSEEISVEESFDIKNLPGEFVFNDMFSGDTRLERSKSFLFLLNLLGQGKVFAKQGLPYSSIECRVL